MAVIKEFFKSHPVLMGLIIAVLVLLFWKVCYELGVNVGAISLMGLAHSK